MSASPASAYDDSFRAPCRQQVERGRRARYINRNPISVSLYIGEQKQVRNIKGQKRRAAGCDVCKLPEGRKKHKDPLLNLSCRTMPIKGYENDIRDIWK